MDSSRRDESIGVSLDNIAGILKKIERFVDFDTRKFLAQVGKIVYVEDLNKDHDRRNVEFGLPDQLTFAMVHDDGKHEMRLEENTRINAGNAPMFIPVENESGEPIQADLPKNTNVKFYQDRSNGAYVTVECVQESSGPCRRQLTGNLIINNKEYTIEPVYIDADTRSFDVHLGTPHTLEELEPDTISTNWVEGNVTETGQEQDFIISEAKMTKSYDSDELGDALELQKEELLRSLLEKLKSLEKRDTTEAHGVELLIVIDHVVYQKFIQRYTDRDSALFAIRQYYSHIVNGVDLRYASIQKSDFSLYVTIAGFHVSTRRRSSPWFNYTSSHTDGLTALKLMRNWRQNPIFPEHDHATLITSTNIMYSGSDAVVGLAYLEGLCSYDRVSVIEERGFFKGASILAHELGHNIGASHDKGKKDSECSSRAGYIMAPSVPNAAPYSTDEHPWRFSNCSIKQIRNFLKSLGDDSCTLDRGSIYDKDEYNSHVTGLAGQLYTEDQQCELLRGKGAKMCTTRDVPEVCRNFGCRSAGSSNCIRYVAAHGTSCGKDLMCFDGACTEKECKGRECGKQSTTTSQPITTSPIVTSTEQSRYFCEDIGIAGYSCKQLQSFLGSKKRVCQRYGHECCQLCSTICDGDKPVKARREFTCQQLQDLFGHRDACTLFTSDCCHMCSTYT